MQDPKDTLIQRQATRIGMLTAELDWAQIQLQNVQEQLEKAQARLAELEATPSESR